MAKQSKKLRAAYEKVDIDKLYDYKEALNLVKELAYTKFDSTVEVAMRLGVNPKHAEQQVRSTVVLPHGTGKTIRVLVFAQGDKVQEAKDAGADFVGAEDIVTKIQKENWLDFDAAVATPDMMKFVGRIGKVLGPRGLMPNPKLGTVTFDVATAVKDLKAGKIEFRVEKAGILHVPIGKTSFPPEKLHENFVAFYDAVMRVRPSAAKGTYMRSCTITSTMGPGLRVDTSSVKKVAQ